MSAAWKQTSACVTANGGDGTSARNCFFSGRILGIAAAVSFFAPILRRLEQIRLVLIPAL